MGMRGDPLCFLLLSSGALKQRWSPGEGSKEDISFNALYSNRGTTCKVKTEILGLHRLDLLLLRLHYVW